MLLDYADHRCRKVSKSAVPSVALALVASAVVWCRGSRLSQWQFLLVNLSAAAAVTCGIWSLAKRRRFWWLGLAALTIGMMVLGMSFLFLMTFTPPMK